MAVELRVASYNILADAHVRPEWFPHTPADVFQPQRRQQALARRVAGLDADIVCLQEVEPDSFAALQRTLEPSGYANGRAKAIDFLFHSRALRARPDRLPELEDLTPLPSETEPSDHLPIAARLWGTELCGR